MESEVPGEEGVIGVDGEDGEDGGEGVHDYVLDERRCVRLFERRGLEEVGWSE